MRSSDPLEVARAYEVVYVRLRQGDLAAAERDLERLASSQDVFVDMKTQAEQLFQWYTGILRRKQGRLTEAETCFARAFELASAADAILNVGRIVLDWAAVKYAGPGDSEQVEARLGEAIQMLQVAVGCAERATDWSTAAKAAKNLGALLSLSDRPELGPPEFRKALVYFERANDRAGIARTKAMMGLTRPELLQQWLYGDAKKD